MNDVVYVTEVGIGDQIYLGSRNEFENIGTILAPTGAGKLLEMISSRFTQDFGNRNAPTAPDFINDQRGSTDDGTGYININQYMHPIVPSLLNNQSRDLDNTASYVTKNYYNAAPATASGG